jgi:hypothetical protein
MHAHVTICRQYDRLAQLSEANRMSRSMSSEELQAKYQMLQMAEVCPTCLTTPTGLHNACAPSQALTPLLGNA